MQPDHVLDQIDRSLANVSGLIDRRGHPDVLGKARERIAKDVLQATCWPGPLDLPALALKVPEQPAFIVKDWFPCGYTTLLAGHGGVGKSGIALTLAVCIAAGLSFFGMQVERRRVLYLSCEDRENILHWRLTRICEYLGVELASLTDWLDILDLVGYQTILWEKSTTGAALTAAYGELDARIRTHESQVLFVDGISDTFGGNENARSEVKAFINALLALIPADEGAMLLMGHIAKPAANGPSTTEGYSGSTAWHNSVRARWYLYPETQQADDYERAEKTGDLILKLQKSNLGPTNHSMCFKWNEEAHLFTGGEVLGDSVFDRKLQDREERQAILAALLGSTEPVPAAATGQRTAFHVLSARPNFPASLKSGRLGKKRFWRHVEEMRQLGLISEDVIRRANRHTTAVLVATGKGRADAPNVNS